MDFDGSHILKPVILSVPVHVRRWHPRDRVIFLGRHAREALSLSAEKSGIALGELTKDADGVPLPSNGYYWSLTHKRRYVAGVASPHPVGIDLEEIRPVKKDLYRRVATEDEWQLARGTASSQIVFFRFWTAKEAVMKANSTGIKDLGNIKICRVVDRLRLEADFAGKRWQICHFSFDDHLAALAADAVQADWRPPKRTVA